MTTNEVKEVQLTAHEEKMISAIVERLRQEKCMECSLTVEHFQDIQSRAPFSVNSEEHYKQHLRVQKFLDMIDESSGIMRKVLITVLVSFLMGALFVGLVLKIKEF